MLLTSDAFLSYCDKHLLRIQKEILQRWHRRGLLYPALRLFLGVVEYTRIYIHHQDRDQWMLIFPHDIKKFQPMKVDPKPWYDLASLWMGNEEWLDQWLTGE
jgi:hypothetical protein